LFLRKTNKQDNLNWCTTLLSQAARNKIKHKKEKEEKRTLGVV